MVSPSDVLIFQTPVTVTLTTATKKEKEKKERETSRDKSNRLFPYYIFACLMGPKYFLLSMVSQKRNGLPVPCHLAGVFFYSSQS